MTETRTARIVGTAYVGDGQDDYWAQGDACRVEVDQSDENEIRVGVLLGESESDDATLYLTEMEAFRLMAALGKVLMR